MSGALYLGGVMTVNCKTSSKDFWTKAQQPIKLSPIFATHCHTSRSVSSRSTSTSKLGVWSLLKVPVR